MQCMTLQGAILYQTLLHAARRRNWGACWNASSCAPSIAGWATMPGSRPRNVRLKDSSGDLNACCREPLKPEFQSTSPLVLLFISFHLIPHSPVTRSLLWNSFQLWWVFYFLQSLRMQLCVFSHFIVLIVLMSFYLSFYLFVEWKQPTHTKSLLHVRDSDYYYF